MSSDFADFLRGKTAVSQATPIWACQNQPIPLRQQTYIYPTLPPDELISSSRAILYRALQRGVREETGWEVRNTAVIGFVHFQHLGLKPPNSPYPYPDFVHAIFLAWASSFDETRMEEDYYVTSSSFQPVADILIWQLHDGQNQLLQTAIKKNMPTL
ncbi:MAG: NUDIX hydrolase [Chloroflexi bacterium]|nr:NUDIX hydrolase [Chloroflexota bacterium]